MIRLIFTLFCTMSILMSTGQDTTGRHLYKPASYVDEKDSKTNGLKSLHLGGKKGEVRYIQDERISVLDDYLKVHPIRHEGYRVQLVFGSRGEVASARSSFLSRWNYPAYEDYLPPNFRLRVGDFVTRIQAEKALQSLKGKFPNAYIVKDKIEIPKEYR